ncbi:MAG: histidinol dehydrogenase [Polyangiaceae bacterium]
MSIVRFTGNLAGLSDRDRLALVDRGFGANGMFEAGVADIIRQVKNEGDAALSKFAKAFDNVELARIEIPKGERERALSALDPNVRKGLERARTNLETVSRAQLPAPMQIEVEPGVIVGRRFDPLARVGVYAPGGKAAYPSSVLMGVVPARVAGVSEVVVCSPPGPNGLPSDVVLAAAEIAGADRVFAIGGAGAIAALAYGTKTVPRVDRIVGPGNAWVAEAKRQVSVDVGIDVPAGPSEILVIADHTGKAGSIARELLAQAEHDEDAVVVALCTTEALANAILHEIESRLATQPRRAIIEAALKSRSAVLTIASLDEAWPFIAAFAPEHLQLVVEDEQRALAKVRNAGTVFLGSAASVAFGDYLTGANHVLPTAGAARRASGLSVLDYVRITTWQSISTDGAARLAGDTTALAESEGLAAHADAARDHLEKRADSRSLGIRARARTWLDRITRYTPKRPPCDVDLTDNTNLFGPPPSVANAFREIPDAAITRYPSPYSDALRAALAREYGVSSDNIVTGAGSDDVIDTIFRAYGDAGEVFAFCPPTFGIVSSFAIANGMRPEACTLDVETIARKNPRIVYLCSPNNPTGALLLENFVDAILKQTRALVLLDEAYAEFSEAPSRVADAATHERLIVVRTFSKAFGLAGLRIGWAVSSPDVIANVERARGPYKLGAVAEKIALAALEDRAWVKDRVAEVKASRARFLKSLEAAKFEALPTSANFVLLPMKNAEAVADRMREDGVSVRAFPNLVGIGDALRISIGPSALMDRCLAALVKATT